MSLESTFILTDIPAFMYAKIASIFFLSGGEEGEEPRYMVHRIKVSDMSDIGVTCSSCVTDELDRKSVV